MAEHDHISTSSEDDNSGTAMSEEDSDEDIKFELVEASASEPSDVEDVEVVHESSQYVVAETQALPTYLDILLATPSQTPTLLKTSTPTPLKTSTPTALKTSTRTPLKTSTPTAPTLTTPITQVDVLDELMGLSSGTSPTPIEESGSWQQVDVLDELMGPLSSGTSKKHCKTCTCFH